MRFRGFQMRALNCFRVSGVKESARCAVLLADALPDGRETAPLPSRRHPSRGRHPTRGSSPRVSEGAPGLHQQQAKGALLFDEVKDTLDSLQ